MKFLSCMLLCLSLAAPVSAASHPSQPTTSGHQTVIVWEVGTLLRYLFAR